MFRKNFSNNLTHLINIQKWPTMDDEASPQIDEEMKQWIAEQKENLQSMYESYCLEMDEPACTFEEFAIYMFYESGH